VRSSLSLSPLSLSPLHLFYCYFLLLSPFYKNSGTFVLYNAVPLNARPALYAPCAGYTFNFSCKNLSRKDLKTLSSGKFLSFLILSFLFDKEFNLLLLSHHITFIILILII
jgi:hypothetical protein